MQAAEIIFFERTFPSANMVLIKDEKPLLIDTGFGSDIEETKNLIEQAGVKLTDLHLIVNTHYHSDHAGGNYHLQKYFGTEIATHCWEAHLINRSDRESGSAEYLDQPIEPYKVNRLLQDGDQIQTGEKRFRVIHTPGHTLGHISLYDEVDQVLITGDLFHRDDVGWLNIFREGVSAVNRSIESLQALQDLPIQVAYSGHGPKIEQANQSIDRAIERLKRWAENPESIGWHACKRIYAYTLIIENGMHKDQVENYLLEQAWFRDFSLYIFQRTPEEFTHEFLHEMVRSEAAEWQDDVLMATAPYDIANVKWMERKIRPKDWHSFNTIY